MLLAQSSETICGIVTHHALSVGERTAFRFLVDGEMQEVAVTFNELRQKALLIASHLQQYVVKGESCPVILLYPSGLEFITALLGCFYANIIAVPSSLPFGKRGKERVMSILHDAGAQFILTDLSTYYSLQKIVDIPPEQWVVTDQITENPFELPKSHFNTPSPEDVAFIQYTSGSTSRPKGVIVSHKNLMTNLSMIQKCFHYNVTTVFGGWLPFFHDMGLIGNILQPLYLGIESVLMAPIAFLQKPSRWLKMITKYKVTSSGGPNFAYDLCVEKVQDKQELDLSTWQVAFNGSETVHSSTLKRFSQAFSCVGFQQQSFCPCYGLAEATLLVTGKPPGTKLHTILIEKQLFEKKGVAKETPDIEKHLSFVSVGDSSAYGNVQIVHPKRKTKCKRYSQGEIWVQGKHVAKGYWNDEMESERTFQESLEGEVGTFLRTGDLGFIDDKDRLYITSRLKDLIILRGRNLIPQDIESSVLESSPLFNLNGAAAFSVEKCSEEVLVIAVEIKREHVRFFNRDTLHEQVVKTVAQHHSIALDTLIFLPPNAVPKTSSGKIQRNKIKQLFLQNKLAKL